MTHRSAEHRNDVALVGRVTTPPFERVLPSGDTICSWRITIDRGGGGCDVVDCTAWTARPQRSAASWGKGDVVEITGALRRRFWRNARGLASAYDVEVHTAKRLVPAATRPRTRE
jgi:single-strand DNA-binding protein